MDSISIIATILTKALDLWTKPVLRFGIEDGRPTIEFNPVPIQRASVDERIAKIEVAKRNLTEALEAMEELQQAAEENKAELATAIERLGLAQKERSSAERELEAVRGIAQSDIEVFKKLAGVPSRMAIAKERFIGFLLGICASVIASGLWWGVMKLWPLFKS
jgi:hypothetical protein